MDDTNPSLKQVQTPPSTNIPVTNTDSGSVMNNPVQSSQVQNNPSQQQTSGIQQPLPSQKNDQQVPLTTHIGTKEGVRIPIDSTEVLTPSNPEIDLSPDLIEAGIETKTEIPTLPVSVEKMGVRHAKESTPVTNLTGHKVKLPMNVAQAQKVINIHKNVHESILWLALLILRQWQLSTQRNHEIIPETKEVA